MDPAIIDQMEEAQQHDALIYDNIVPVPLWLATEILERLPISATRVRLEYLIEQAMQEHPRT